MKWNQRRVHGSHIVTVALERPLVSHIMSIKIVDILKACKQWQVEQALGLVEARNRYGGVERTSNMQVPPPWNISSTTEDSSSFSTNPSISSQSQHGWNHNNAARFEDGTTFYSQIRKQN